MLTRFRLLLGLLGPVLIALGCGSSEKAESSRDAGLGSGGHASGGRAGGDASSDASTGGTGLGPSTGGGGAGGTTSDASANGGSAGADAAPAEVPAELLDLKNWKLTLPIAAAGTTSPLEILQPELSSYSIDPYFHLNGARDGVLFRAHAGGATTSSSGYPRSELREMKSDGIDLQAWSTTSGSHAMTIRQAILALPSAKPHVVAGQIHDASDDVVMIRLEANYLFVEGGGNDLGALDNDYTLGTTFSVMLSAENGRIRVYYNDMNTPKVDVARSRSGCYFKAGDYTQSNTSTGDSPDAYGEVVIYDLLVIHR